MNSQTVTVNLVPGLSAPAVVRVSQGDIGRPLVFRVMDGMSTATLPQYWSAKVEGTKPSGLGFSETCTISGSTVTVSTTEAMTQECGQIFAEISFTYTGVVIGTANFILAVEPSPHPEGTTDGTQETMQNLETRLQGEIDELSDRIDDIEAGGSGLSQTEKNLILTLFSKAAYAESDAETAYDQLEALWASSTKTITYNLSNVVSSNTQTSIESGQPYSTALAVRQSYTLNSVTVTMGGVDITSTSYSSGTITIPSVTGNIVITATAVLAAQSITATYTQSGTVYDTDSLDSLKSDLVVTANYAGGTSEVVPSTDYTLSGTLEIGTSTVTVTYSSLTTTFNVTVTKGLDYTEDALTGITWNNDYDYDHSTGVLKTSSGAHCTDKFTAQDCLYQVVSTNSSDSYFDLYVWDTSDTFLGYIEINARTIEPIQIMPNYKYAIRFYNTSSFDSTKVTMMPVDHRSTAVETFTFSLADYVNDFTKQSTNTFELDATATLGQYVSSSSFTTINKVNAPAIFGLRANNFKFVSYAIGFWGNSLLLRITIPNVTTLADAQTYITNNDIQLTFNGR